MEEDTVSYTIYLPLDPETELSNLLERCMTTVLPHTSAYIWHEDGFSLWPDQSGGCLRGRTKYGDNVEDEWFVVSLLLMITSEIEGAVARVEDADEEFLLIEAADHLPEWAQEPEVAQGRVFLYGGRIHLIPVAEKPSELSPMAGISRDLPGESSRAKVVADQSFSTEASVAIQETIIARLKEMPYSCEENLHYAHMPLPLKAAQILHQSPQLISLVVHRLMELDPKDAKVLRKMTAFKRDSESVRTGVQMTKCLYAMLDSKQIWPGKESGWRSDEEKQGSPEWAEAMRGYKVSAGMELLLDDAERLQEEGGQDEKRYLAKLEELGYFRGLLPGSREHSDLLQNARMAFAGAKVSQDHAARRDVYRAHFKICYENADKVESAEREARSRKVEKKADSDEWLVHNQESLDEMLKQHFHLDEAEESGVRQKLEEFLKEESDMKGVEVNKEEEEEEDLEKPINVNFDEFEAALKKIMDGDAGEDDGSNRENRSDDEDEADMAKQLEDELLTANVKDGKELMLAMRSLYEEMKEAPVGPSKTFLENIRK